MHNIYVYIIIMAAVTYLIRALPLTLIRRHIDNRFIRSFLYYVPFVTLSVMTFPSIITATESPIAAAVAFVVAVALAWLGKSLFVVSVSACVVVFILELII
ncbi:MAG: AzlD domain-containing protein [Clostridia bacterium]|nr:AzlD domain-containing protein [Clostridia bacterium]